MREGGENEVKSPSRNEQERLEIDAVRNATFSLRVSSPTSPKEATAHTALIAGMING